MRPLILLAALPVVVLALSLPLLWVIENGRAPGFVYLDTPTPTATPEEVPYAMPTLLPTVRPTSSVQATRQAVVLPTPHPYVVYGGCASDGECHWYNFYWVPTGEAVMQSGEPALEVEHELCHRHQHLTINGGASTAIDLSEWNNTPEAASYGAVADGWPYPKGTLNGRTLLEDYAWACAYMVIDPGWLAEVSPARYEWMNASN